MNSSQNVRKMSTVSLVDTSTETMTALTYNCNGNQMIKLLHSTNSLRVLQDVISMSQVRVLHRLCWKCYCSCVLSRLKNKSS